MKLETGKPLIEQTKTSGRTVDFRALKQAPSFGRHALVAALIAGIVLGDLS